MVTYSFKCASGHRFALEASIKQGPPQTPNCPECGASGSRDYRSDLSDPQIFIPMHMSSKNTSNKSDFLPSEKDFESPTDPTGEKGMKEWKADHVTRGFNEF